jgi:hypothetical protein
VDLGEVGDGGVLDDGFSVGQVLLLRLLEFFEFVQGLDV